jgi:hypothetical protein
MADTQTKINIVELDIDQDQALQDLTELQQQLVETKDDIKKLEKANKELAAQDKDNSAQIQKNSKQIEEKKLQVKGLNKEYTTQQKVVANTLQTNQRELGTLEKLTLQNKELRGELRTLNLETKEGQKRRAEINKQVESNTKTIQKNSDAYVQQKMNIGNYQSALSGVSPGLSRATGGLMGLTQAAKAFIATPLGLILLAIAAAIKIVSEGFKRSQGLLDKFAGFMKGVGAALDAVFDRVAQGLEKLVEAFKNPGEAIKKFAEAIKTNLVNRVQALPAFFKAVFEAIKNTIKGNMDEAKEAVKDAGQAFIQFNTGLDPEQQKRMADAARGLTKEIKEEAKAARDLELATRALKDEQIDFIVARAEGRKEQAKARLVAEDETIAIEERIKGLKEAVQIEKNILQQEIYFAEQEAALLQAKIDLGKSEREDYEELAQAKAKAFELQTASLKQERRLQMEVNRLVDEKAAADKAREKEQADRIKKEAEDLQKFVENEVKIWELRNQSVVEGEKNLTKELIQAEEERLNLLEQKQLASTEQAYQNKLISEQEYQLQVLQIQKDTNDKKLKLEEDFVKQRQDVQEKQAAQLFELQKMELERQLGSEFEIRRQTLDNWYADQQELAKGNQEVLNQLELTYAAARIEINKLERQARIEGLKGIFQAAQGLLEKNTVAYKAAATAVIAIDTYKAAIAAYSAVAGIPIVGPALGVIAAGLATATGLKAIQKTWAVDTKAGVTSVAKPTGGNGASISANIPEANISGSGGLVERNLDQQASNPKTVIEKQPVLVTDRVTADQENWNEIETLSSV